MFFSFLCFLNIHTFKYLFMLICIFYFMFCILSLTFFDLSYSIIVNNKKKSIDFLNFFICPNFEYFVVQILGNLLCRFWVFCCANFKQFVVQILTSLHKNFLLKFYTFMVLLILRCLNAHSHCVLTQIFVSY